MRLYIMCGLPGSGKSEFVQHFIAIHPPVTVICRDAIRKALNGMNMFVPSKEGFVQEKVKDHGHRPWL